MTESKRCTKCGEEKPLEEFYVDRKGREGRSSRCRACINEVITPGYRSRNKAGTKLDNCAVVRGARWRSVCGILNVHHDTLKDDPERLSTSFINSIIGEKISNTGGSE